MTNRAAKDPKRQIQGAVSRAQGRRFEERLDDSFAYYADRGFAIVEKTPEPMRPTKSLGNGKFIAFFEKKAQPDYKGTIKGGRTVGARCYVVVGFASGDVYRIPWDVWSNMKTFFGRKYVKETDLEKFRVHIAWNGVLQLLE